MMNREESCGAFDPRDRSRRCILVRGHADLPGQELVTACAKPDPLNPGRRCHGPAGHAAECRFRGAKTESFKVWTEGDPDFAEDCHFFTVHGFKMTKEKATGRLAELLESILSDPRQFREVSARFNLFPPESIGSDESRAEWLVDQIAEADLWTDVVAFRNEGASGCSCRLSGAGRRWGAGGRHWRETDSEYWTSRMVDDDMIRRGIGTSYREKYISGLSADELEGIQLYCDRMAGTPVAYEDCPAYARAVEGAP